MRAPPRVLCGTTESACAKAAAARIGLGCGGIDVVGVEAELIVDLALLGIAEDVVGFGDRLEFLFGRLVAGIHVGMIFARKFAEGLADVLRRGRLLHAEGGVIVLLGWWWPLLAISRQLSAFSSMRHHSRFRMSGRISSCCAWPPSPMGITMFGMNPTSSSLITGIALMRPVASVVIRYQRPSSRLKCSVYDWLFTSNRNWFLQSGEFHVVNAG